MSVRFTVLASGSSGNAALVEVGSFGVLIDAGLGPRQAGRVPGSASRELEPGSMLPLLTHTHSDHWNDRTLGHLHRRGLPLYCHADHAVMLQRSSPAFTALRQARLVVAALRPIRTCPWRPVYAAVPGPAARWRGHLWLSLPGAPGPVWRRVCPGLPGRPGLLGCLPGRCAG